ncbi:hypothetical protein CYY_005407 [Polysphondylium violaceum]|uniref:Uncharacterized protein n=1 Tax=Polysphondylium violaceum TaxID=133409 RepID=A0A8J4PRV1_9MYCE|nr:hypothetical protein CYY_005407 [Polysphondylium violaceum]
MNINIYRAVFSNVYLSKKIYQTISDRQKPYISLKYDDIFDIGWMIKNGHVGLAREKINNSKCDGYNRNSSIKQLYLNPEDLFTTPSFQDNDLLISLFEKYKFHMDPCGLYCLDEEKKEKQFKNKVILKYLYDHGYGVDLRELHINRMDIDIVRYLLEIGWLQTAPILDIFCIRFEENEVEYTQEMIDLVFQYHKATLSPDQTISLLRNTGPSRLKRIQLLWPHFDQRIKNDKNNQKSFEEIHIRARIEETQNDMIGRYIPLNGKIEGRFVLPIYCSFARIIEKGDTYFFDLLTAFSDEFIINADGVQYDGTFLDDFLDEADDARDLYEDIASNVGPFIVRQCHLEADINILEFLYTNGYTTFRLEESYTKLGEMFYSKLIKKTSQKDRSLIVKLASSEYNEMINRNYVIQACCRYGDVESFNYYFPLFLKLGFISPYVDPGLEYDFIPIIFQKVIEHKQYHIYKALESFGYRLSDYANYFCLILGYHSLADTFDNQGKSIVDRAIDAQDPHQKRHNQKKIMINMIERNDFIGIRYMLANNLFQICLSVPSKVIESLSKCQHLGIIEYIFNNKSQFFPSTFTDKDIENFEIELFEAAAKENNLPLTDYLVSQNHINLATLTPEQYSLVSCFYDPADNSVPLLFGNYIQKYIYLIEHKNYDSIAPFTKTILDPTLDFVLLNPVQNIQNALEAYKWGTKKFKTNLQLLEYIDKNRHRFKSPPTSFQPLFDELIYTKSKLAGYIKLFGALVNRYQCTLNDSHYHYLTKYYDGLTLFNLVPNSLFVSDGYHPPPSAPINESPLKKKRSINKINKRINAQYCDGTMHMQILIL